MAPAAVRLQQEETHIMPLLLLQEPGAEVAGLTDLGAVVMGGTAVAAAAAREEQRGSSTSAGKQQPGSSGSTRRSIAFSLACSVRDSSIQSAAADGGTAVEEQQQ